MNKRIEIDNESGFCFGVVNAIRRAEDELASGQPLYCLGDIVHNTQEIHRLESAGLVTIDHAQMEALSQKPVLLRAHGEPPSTYRLAEERGITLIDATCPVVLGLQRKIKTTYEQEPAATQIVIYGKRGHAEVNGLVGQTEGRAIVVEGVEDLDQVDPSRKICLYSQTTKSIDGFEAIVAALQKRLQDGVGFEWHDTICRQVSNRIPKLRKFVADYDLVLFVAGKKSSNGRFLYEECRKANPNTHLISLPEEIDLEWIAPAQAIGICGATSTPRWLMEQVAEYLKQTIINKE